VRNLDPAQCNHCVVLRRSIEHHFGRIIDPLKYGSIIIGSVGPTYSNVLVTRLDDVPAAASEISPLGSDGSL
jgi:hypothetical protein